MSRRRTALDELSFLHSEFVKKRTLFCTSRSIDRLREALNNFVRPFGDVSAARHAIRFNFIGKGRRFQGDDLSFVLNTIRSFDNARAAAAKRADRAAKRMALKIHLGLVKGKSKRKAGSWATRSYVSAALGPSECKSFCRRIIVLNRKRFRSSRLSKPVICSLEKAIQKISSCEWKSSPIGASAFTSSTKVLLMEYRRLQTGFYLPIRFRGPATSRYLAALNPLVRFSVHYMIKEGMSFLDIGAGIRSASALAARTPSVSITAIEPDDSMRRVLRTNLEFLRPAASAVLSPPVP